MNPKTKKLTAAQVRVAIVKDVLKQIKARRYIVKTGKFVASRLDGVEHYNQKSVGKLKRCAVCAVGAAIVSAIRLFNKIDNPMIDTPHPLVKFFSYKQVRLIELAFEGGGGWYNRGADDQALNAVSFGKRYADRTKRARAIFENTIVNNGKFIP